MKSYKNFRCYYAILAVLITGFYLSSCKKTEPLTSNGTESSHSMEEKFFGNHRSNDPTEVAFVEFLKRVNEKENFVEKTVMQIGYPRWDKTFIKPKNLPNLQQNLTGDSTEHYYIPFVRDSQNFVNAAMIITATPTDTSFSYRVDCDYRQLANSTTSVHDDAEYQAIFFMFMDKRVFGYHKFAIKDSNLFKENGNKATKIELTAAAANPTNGNLWDYVEFCQDVNISYPNCPEDPGHCGGIGGSCDNCFTICTTTISYRYCWWEWAGTGGGGTTTTGGGGSPGSPTPPSSCQGGGGTTPIPTIPDEPEPWEDGYFLFSYTHLNNPVFVDDEPVEMPPGYQFTLFNFNVNTTNPIRVIGKTDPRGNTEDMQYGHNCNATGILSNMPNFTDAQLFAEVEDLFHKTSTGALQTVGDVMIDRFRNNLAGQFTDATLSQAVFDNSKFQNFIVKFGKELHLALAANNWNINQVPPITMLQRDRPAFNGLHNQFHGLQILVNDTEETIIELTNFSINTTTHKWTADLNITIKDHFGLDKNDALTYQNYHAGFAAWWILQHCRGYKPFETKISFKMQLQTQ